MVNLVSRSAHLCLWSARARVAGRAKPQVECGPGLALLGVEVQAGLLPRVPEAGEDGEEVVDLPPVGVLHDGGQVGTIGLTIWLQLF